MNDVLEMMWEETSMDYFKELSDSLNKTAEENDKKPSSG
jgi:hypothetical protein